MLLGLVLTGADKLFKEVKVGSSLGCSDRALVNFVISRNTGLAKSSQDPRPLKSNLQAISKPRGQDLLEHCL